MALAQGNLVATRILAEVTPGVTPAAAMTTLNTTSSKLTPNITSTTSTTIRSDRMVSDLVHTAGSSTFDIGFELRFSEYLPLIESALAGTTSTLFTLTATDISASAVDNSINSFAAAFSTVNILPGHWLKIKGLAQGTRIGKVVSVTTAKIVLSHVTLTTEAAGASVTVAGRSVRNGTTKKTFTVENQFTDLTNVFESSVGQIVNTFNLNAASGAIVTGTFGMMGRAITYGAATVGTGAPSAVGTEGIMSGVANVSTLYIDGALLTGTFVKSSNLSVTANARNLDAIGNLYPVDINLGSVGAVISAQLYFADATYLNKFVNGTELSVAYTFTDAAGNVMVVDVPRAKLSAGSNTGAALNADVLNDITMTSLASTTLPYQIQISLLPA